MSKPFVVFSGLISLLGAACFGSQQDAKLAARGRAVYQTNCIACHNSDPSKPGTLGPDVRGSSLALIEARVMRAEYPKGYSPKRQTHMMIPLPQLKFEIPAIHAYLNEKEAH